MADRVAEARVPLPREEAVERLCHEFLENQPEAGVFVIGLAADPTKLLVLVEYGAPDQTETTVERTLRDFGSEFDGIGLEFDRLEPFQVSVAPRPSPPPASAIPAAQGTPRPGLPLREAGGSASAGALGCFVKVDGTRYLLTAEHVLPNPKKPEDKPRIETRDPSWFECGRATAVNSGLSTGSPTDVGDYELGEVTAASVELQPKCPSVDFSGKTLEKDQVAQLGGREVRACRNTKWRGATVAAVGACARVRYGDEILRFEDQIIVKSGEWDRRLRSGDSGSLVVLHEAAVIELEDGTEIVLEKGDAVGVFYVVSGLIAGLAPMYKVLDEIEGELGFPAAIET